MRECGAQHRHSLVRVQYRPPKASTSVGAFFRLPLVIKGSCLPQQTEGMSRQRRPDPITHKKTRASFWLVFFYCVPCGPSMDSSFSSRSATGLTSGAQERNSASTSEQPYTGWLYWQPVTI